MWIEARQRSVESGRGSSERRPLSLRISREEIHTWWRLTICLNQPTYSLMMGTCDFTTRPQCEWFGSDGRINFHAFKAAFGAFKLFNYDSTDDDKRKDESDTTHRKRAVLTHAEYNENKWKK